MKYDYEELGAKIFIVSMAILIVIGLVSATISFGWFVGLILLLLIAMFVGGIMSGAFS